MSAMLPQRPLGATGEHVAALGLGTGYIGAWRDTPHDAAIQVVRHALALGMTYLDTSPYYSNAQSLLGEALAGVTAPYYLSTKCGRWDYRSGPFRSVDAFKRQLDDSLAALRRDHLDNLNIHECDWYAYWEDVAVPRDDPHIEPHARYDYAGAPVVAFLRWAKEQGLTRHIGITGNNAHLVGKVLREIELPVDSVLVAYQYDMIWRNTAEFVVPTAQERGVAVILGGTFQRGRLTEVHPEWLEQPPDWMTPDLRERFARLYALQAECGLSLAELGTRYLLGVPGVTCLVPGTSKPERLDEYAAHALAGPLPADLHAELEVLGTVVPGPHWPGSAEGYAPATSRSTS